MRKRTLGNLDGITEVGFGAWGIGGGAYGEVGPDEARGVIQAYVAGGGTFIDTARGYRESEDRIGETLSARGGAAHVRIASKTPKLDEPCVP